jgi:hypothetical protein
LFRPFGAGWAAKEMFFECGQFRLLDQAEVVAFEVVIGVAA